MLIHHGATVRICIIFHENWRKSVSVNRMSFQQCLSMITFIINNNKPKYLIIKSAIQMRPQHHRQPQPVGNGKPMTPRLMHPLLLRKQYLIRSLIWRQYLAGASLPLHIFHCNIKLFSAFIVNEKAKLIRNQWLQAHAKDYDLEKVYLGWTSTDLVKLYHQYIADIETDQARKEQWRKSNVINHKKGNSDYETIDKVKLFLSLSSPTMCTLPSIYRKILPLHPPFSTPHKYKQPLLPPLKNPADSSTIYSSSEQTSPSTSLHWYLNTLLQLSNGNHIDDIDVLILSSLQLESWVSRWVAGPLLINAVLNVMPEWKFKYQQEFILRYQTRHYGAIVGVGIRLCVGMLVGVTRMGWGGRVMSRALESIVKYIQGANNEYQQYLQLKKQGRQDSMNVQVPPFAPSSQTYNLLLSTLYNLLLTLPKSIPSQIPITVLQQLLETLPNKPHFSSSCHPHSPFTGMQLLVCSYVHYVWYLCLRMLFSRGREQFGVGLEVALKGLVASFIHESESEGEVKKEREISIAEGLIKETIYNLYQLRKSSTLPRTLSPSSNQSTPTPTLTPYKITLHLLQLQLLLCLQHRLIQVINTNVQLSSWLMQNGIRKVKAEIKKKEGLGKECVDGVAKAWGKILKMPKVKGKKAKGGNIEGFCDMEIQLAITIGRIVLNILQTLWQTQSSAPRIHSSLTRSLLISTVQHLTKHQVILLPPHAVQLLLRLEVVLKDMGEAEVVKGFGVYMNKLRKYGTPEMDKVDGQFATAEYRINNTRQADTLWQKLLNPTCVSQLEHLRSQLFLLNKASVPIIANSRKEIYQRIKYENRVKSEEEDSRRRLSVRMLRNMDQDDYHEEVDEEQEEQQEGAQNVQSTSKGRTKHKEEGQEVQDKELNHNDEELLEGNQKSKNQYISALDEFFGP